MPLKVKRGLGLLVIALIGVVLVALLQNVSNDLAVGATLALALVIYGCGGVGLVLIAWGLLRD